MMFGVKLVDCGVCLWNFRIAWIRWQLRHFYHIVRINRKEWDPHQNSYEIYVLQFSWMPPKKHCINTEQSLSARALDTDTMIYCNRKLKLREFYFILSPILEINHVFKCGCLSLLMYVYDTDIKCLPLGILVNIFVHFIDSDAVVEETRTKLKRMHRYSSTQLERFFFLLLLIQTISMGFVSLWHSILVMRQMEMNRWNPKGAHTAHSHWKKKISS